MKATEKIAVRLILFAVRILLGYSFNAELKAMEDKIHEELKEAK